MESAAAILIRQVTDDPTRVLLPDIERVNPADAVMYTRAKVADMLAGLGLDIAAVQIEGGSTELHEEVSSVLQETLYKLGRIGARLEGEDIALVDFVSFFDVRAKERFDKEEVAGLDLDAETLEPSAEWPAFEEYGKPEVICNARKMIDGVVNPYGFAGDDFSVVKDGDIFKLVLSTPLSAILRDDDKCIFEQSTGGAIVFKKTGLRIEGLDIRGLPSGYYTSLANGMGAQLYRAMQSSKPVGWPQMDSPQSRSATLVTLLSDVSSSSNRGKVLRTDADGKVVETKVGYNEVGEGYGIRFVYELPRQ